MSEESNTTQQQQQPDAANSYQVGGQHYRIRDGEQLWDRLVRLYGLANARVFFIGNIIFLPLTPDTTMAKNYTIQEALQILLTKEHTPCSLPCCPGCQRITAIKEVAADLLEIETAGLLRQHYPSAMSLLEIINQEVFKKLWMLPGAN